MNQATTTEQGERDNKKNLSGNSIKQNYLMRIATNRTMLTTRNYNILQKERTGKEKKEKDRQTEMKWSMMKHSDKILQDCTVNNLFIMIILSIN